MMLWSEKSLVLPYCSALLSLLLLWPAARSEITGLKLLSDTSPASLLTPAFSSFHSKIVWILYCCTLSPPTQEFHTKISIPLLPVNFTHQYLILGVSFLLLNAPRLKNWCSPVFTEDWKLHTSIALWSLTLWPQCSSFFPREWLVSRKDNGWVRERLCVFSFSTKCLAKNCFLAVSRIMSFAVSCPPSLLSSMAYNLEM